MASYALQRLGGVGFQEVVAALAIKEFGPQIRPMGRGKDGGRDLLVDEGVLVWSAHDGDEHAETWKGTTVFQIKHKETLEGPQKDAASFWNSIKAELDKWANPATTRGDVPDYLVFVTNVCLTAASGSGAFDTVNAKIQRYIAQLSDESAEDGLPKSAKDEARERRRVRRDRMSRLQTWRLWDGNQIAGLLDAHGDVRRGFDGFLTPGDVLADLSMLSTYVNQKQLGAALREHARTALMAERRVYFDDAGGETKGVPVEEIAIDLPILVDAPQTGNHAIRYVLNRGERILKPSLTTLEKPRHLLLTGAPGNGKSTVAKFLTHAYRTTFLNGSLELSDDHRKTVVRTKDALQAMGVRVPANRRWPINIDLAKFALEQGTSSDYTLLHSIAAALSRQVTSKDIPRWELKTWLKRWPSFIVLDGLDEVTEPSVRKSLIINIETFVTDAEADDCDILVVVTTRPTGYEDEMQSSVFERIDLADLTVDDALRYGQLVTRVRIPDDHERRDSVVAALQQAAADERTRHLLRTPLQTLIMSIIAETSRQFSPSRFALFWGYYTTIAKREQNKRSSLATLLREHSQQILELHRRIGLQLQRLAETGTRSDAVLTPTELRNAAWQVLADDEYQPATHDAILLDRIVQAATHRLVLLAPHPDGGYGFDVRSLQELMAAYALTTGTLDETIPKLRAIAPSPHWRNTFLFAAGRYFAEPQPHQQKAIAELVLALDENASERLGSAFPVGPTVAAEIIDDNMVSAPKHLNPLIDHALTALKQPGLEQADYARMLITASAASEAVRERVADGLRNALGGSPVSHSNAEAVQRAIYEIGKATAAPTAVLGLASVRHEPSRTHPADRDTGWAKFSTVLNEYSDLESEAPLRTVIAILEAVDKTQGFHNQQLDDLLALIDDPDIAFVFDEALPHLLVESPQLGTILRHDMLPRVWRQPVDLGDDLL